MNNGRPAAEKLGTEPVKSLLISMAIPSIVAMLMQALYNTVNSMYVARISEGCFAAVTLAFPVQMIIGAMSTGIGVGINSSIARHLGANPFIRMYSDDPEVIAAGTIYVRTICILALGSIFTQISFSVLQGSGNMVMPMMSQRA